MTSTVRNFLGLALIALLIHASAKLTPGATQQISPGPGKSHYDGIAPPWPASLEFITDNAPVVVDATVDSVFPAVEVGPDRRLETDSQLRVDRILKGPLQLTQIVVSQMGGVRGQRKEVASGVDPFMNPGERYILFLQFVPATRLAALPPRNGLPRYDIYLATWGVFRADHDHVETSEALPVELRNQNRGKPLEQFLAEITARLRSGRPQ
jgi:hypothetical protein